jgi:hypothetical protein
VALPLAIVLHPSLMGQDSSRWSRLRLL